MSRPLDFIVIGTQKGGTTSLWQYLRDHERICMPRVKEAPFFTREGAMKAGAYESYMRTNFGDAPAGALLGKATPQYMKGRLETNVTVIAERIATVLPDVRLVALLRDPIERAGSHFRMLVRRGWEQRDFDSTMRELLAPGELNEARTRPTPINSYVVQGEYGRVLGAYRARFPAEQLLVGFSRDFADDPGALLDEVLGFLGLPCGYRPEGLGLRHFRGGVRKRLDPTAERELLEFLDRDVFPYLEGDGRLTKTAFGFFFETWNVIPDDEPLQLGADTRARLEEHFRADAAALAALGVGAPWLEDWSGAQASDVSSPA